MIYPYKSFITAPSGESKIILYEIFDKDLRSLLLCKDDALACDKYVEQVNW